MSVGTALVLFAAAGFVGLLGGLIKYAGAVRLIAGYDPDRVADEEGLADFVGTNALYVAALLAAVGVLEYAAPVGDAVVDAVWLAFLVAVAALAVRMIVGSRRYQVDG